MRVWWQERSQRERLMLIGLGFLALGLFVFQFVFMPITRYRDRSFAAYEDAIVLLNEIEDGARRMASRPAANAAAGGETNIRIVATETAREMGVPVTRLNPAENDGLSIWLDGTEPTLLFRWLLRLREEHGIAVWRASIHKGEGNLLQAEFTLGGGQP